MEISSWTEAATSNKQELRTTGDHKNWHFHGYFDYVQSSATLRRSVTDLQPSSAVDINAL